MKVTNIVYNIPYDDIYNAVEAEVMEDDTNEGLDIDGFIDDLSRHNPSEIGKFFDLPIEMEIPDDVEDLETYIYEETGMPVEDYKIEGKEYDKD